MKNRYQSNESNENKTDNIKGDNTMNTSKQDSNFQKNRKNVNRKKKTNGKGSAYSRPQAQTHSRNSGHNDVSWYISDPDLLRDSGKLSFNNPLGTNLDRNEFVAMSDSSNYYIANDLAPTGFNGQVASVPGILTLRTLPVFGISTSATSPLNIASRKLFAYLRHTLSNRLQGVEAPDTMIYLQAMDSIYSFYAYLCRAYGTLAAYSATNRYVGKQMLTAMGLDYNDIETNLADLKYYITLFKTKVNVSLKVPGDFGVFKRHFWLFSNSFKDSPVGKSQIYMHVPAGFYKYSPVKYDTGGANVFTPFNYTNAPSPGAKFSDLRQFGNDMLDALLQDDDINNLSGVILRAYGDEGCFVLPDIPEDYTIFPTYNEEILGQIHNAQIVNCDVSDFTTGTLDVRQVIPVPGEGDPHLEFAPCLFRDLNEKTFPRWVVNGFSKLMDSFTDIPTPEEVLINSRNMFALANVDIDVTTSRVSAEISHCGLDIILDTYMYYLIDGAPAAQRLGSCGFIDESGSYNAMANLASLTKFDWAPRFSVIAREVSPEGETALQIVLDAWDFNNTTKVDDFTVFKLHETALLGALKVPGRASAYQR